MSKIAIRYCKIKKLNVETLEKESSLDNSYSPFSIRDIQCYNPIYSQFFKMNETNYDSIALNHKYHIVDLNRVIDLDSDKELDRPIFVKFSPLLDPIRYMIGKYKDVDISLPTIQSAEMTDKINNSHNASYTDNFFYYLSSQTRHHHGIISAIDYYGSFLGIQEKYRMDVAEDIEYLNSSKYYMENKGKLFTIDDSEINPFANFGSRGNKHRIAFVEEETNEMIELEVEDLESNPIGQSEPEEIEEVYEQQSNHSSTVSTNDSEVNYTDDEGESDEDEQDTEEETNSIPSVSSSNVWEDVSEEEGGSQYDEDCAVYAYINNYPIQMICLEKCDGTLDELLESDLLDEKEASVVLMQVIMTLIIYQKLFDFTHNDLHTNNIMYINTDIEFLYYKYAGVTYKIPTYGKIFKIIDFGRAIYSFQGKRFCSDSFQQGGDGFSQYNCEPFYDPKKPKIDPNPAFDLCRLGCSIYDFLFDDDEDLTKIDEFQKTILRWCTDDKGKNMLYKKSGEERYPGFKLYKMIARTVHHHTPEAQLAFPFFSKFANKGHIEDLIDIDALPKYVS